MATSGGRQVETRRYALIRPLGMVGSGRQWLVSAVLCAALLVVFVLEVLTPNDVVGDLAFLPLMAALWLLSWRFAVPVVLLAAALVLMTGVVETNNRLTVLSQGAAELEVAVRSSEEDDDLHIG